MSLSLVSIPTGEAYGQGGASMLTSSSLWLFTCFQELGKKAEEVNNKERAEVVRERA